MKHILRLPMAQAQGAPIQNEAGGAGIVKFFKPL